MSTLLLYQRVTVSSRAFIRGLRCISALIGSGFVLMLTIGSGMYTEGRFVYNLASPNVVNNDL